MSQIDDDIVIEYDACKPLLCNEQFAPLTKPYSTGYYSYAKNYVKNFGIFPFSEEQKRHLMSLQTKEEIDAYLLGIYEIAI